MQKELQTAVATIQKTYGKTSIMLLGSGEKLPVKVIPSGSLGLDIALGVGGYPRGRVIEIYGPESGGKTTMSLHLIAEAQKLGGQAAFIDAEHALDPGSAEKLGVDTDNLLVSQPDNGEQALEIAEHLIRSNQCDVIVIDSVAALVPRAELEGEMGQPQMGLQAALKFYASVRIDVRRMGKPTEGEGVKTGNPTRVKVVKNKMAAPFREAEFEIVYGEGISKESELVTLGIDKGVLEKSGTWISFGGERLGQGAENAREFLKLHPQIAQRIETLIRGQVFAGKAETAK